LGTGDVQAAWAAQRPSGFEAVSRHRHAAIARRCDDGRDDEGHGLAAAFGARIPCRRGAQAAQAQARVAEGRRHPGLPDRWRGKQQAPASQVRAPVVLSACRASGLVLPCRTARHSTARLRACAISTSGGFEAIGITYSGGDHTPTCPATSCSAFWRIGCKPTYWVIWTARAKVCSTGRCLLRTQGDAPWI